VSGRAEAFLADVCVPVSVGLRLRQSGHDVRVLVGPERRLSDDDILALALDEDRIVLTADKDFGELTVRFAKPSIGIVLLLIGSLPASERGERVAAALGSVAGSMRGHLVTVLPDRVKVRPLQARE
jgi:predicted nuclease of predicted toxin-antitoxin system